MANLTKKIAELERSVRQHLSNLEDLLEHPDIVATDRYLILAGILRVLLCDKTDPVLLHYAELKKIELRIWADKTFPNSVRKQILSGGHFYPCEWDPEFVYGRGLENLSIQEFLDSPVGVVHTDEHNIKTGGRYLYSAKELIRWISNKEGMSHLNHKKPPAIEALRHEHSIGMIFVTKRMAQRGWTLDKHSGDTRFKDKPIDMYSARLHMVILAEWAHYAIKHIISYSDYFRKSSDGPQLHYNEIPPSGTDPIIDAVVHRRVAYGDDIDQLIRKIATWVDFRQMWDLIDVYNPKQISRLKLELEILLTSLQNNAVPGQFDSPRDFPCEPRKFYTLSD